MIFPGPLASVMQMIFIYLASSVIPELHGQRGGLSACSKEPCSLNNRKVPAAVQRGLLSGQISFCFKRKETGYNKEDKTTAAFAKQAVFPW